MRGHHQKRRNVSIDEGLRRNQSNPDLSFNFDLGNYKQYAGEPCTKPRPDNCSAIHARDGRIYYYGEVGPADASGIYPWGSQ